MKLTNWKNLDRKEFRDFPPSVERLLQPLNEQLRKITQALQRGLSFDDNVDGFSRTISATHGVEDEFEIKTKAPLTAAAVVYADNYPKPMPLLAWKMAGQSRVKFTCYFLKEDLTPDTGAQANVRLEFKV